MLPAANQLLFRYLICLLHRVQLHSSDNLMTSYNLSVCIGPCILWTKSTSNTELERAGQTIPKLLEFIIMNCVDIFGVEIFDMLKGGSSTLTKKSSVSLDSVFTDRPSRSCVADSCHSIDMLTLNVERCHNHRQQLSPSRLSGDSGMILDDHSHADDDTAQRPSHNQQQHRNRHINTSYDSLDCDADLCSDDEILHNNNTLHYTTTKQPHQQHAITAAQKSQNKMSMNVTIDNIDGSASMGDYEKLIAPKHMRSISDVLPAVNESATVTSSKSKKYIPQYIINKSHQR